MINGLSFLGEYLYGFELLTHFRFHYLLFFLLLGGLSIIFYTLKAQKKKWMLIALFGLSLNITSVFSFYLPKTAVVNHETKITVLLANVLSRNPDKAGFIKLIQQKQADFVVVLEVSPAWAEALQKDTFIDKLYPYRKVIPRDDNFGIALYSQHPLDNIIIEDFGRNQLPSINAVSSIKGKQLGIIATHPFPPMNKVFHEQQKQHFKGLTDIVNNSNYPTIIAGDLNTTLWSTQYKKLIQSSALLNTREGMGIYPTWPAGFIFQIPLDHILVSKAIQTLKLESLAANGSDHLPLYAELRF